MLDLPLYAVYHITVTMLLLVCHWTSQFRIVRLRLMCMKRSYATAWRVAQERSTIMQCRLAKIMFLQSKTTLVFKVTIKGRL